MSNPLNPNPVPDWDPASEPNGGTATSDSSGQLRAIPGGDNAPPATRPNESRTNEQRVAGHCLWPAVEVSGPETAQLRFRQRPKPKPPLSAVLPSVPPVTAPKARNAAESASSTGIFERAPSGVHPAAESASRASESSARISSRFLEQPVAKRRDPRAATPVAVPQVKPQPQSNGALYRWTRRVLYAVIVVSIVSGAAMVAIRLQEDARIEAEAADRADAKGADLAAVRERMSKLEAEAASNRALIRKQEQELKGMQCDMTEFERSSTEATDHLNRVKTP